MLSIYINIAIVIAGKRKRLDCNIGCWRCRRQRRVEYQKRFLFIRQTFRKLVKQNRKTFRFVKEFIEIVESVCWWKQSSCLQQLLSIFLNFHIKASRLKCLDETPMKASFEIKRENQSHAMSSENPLPKQWHDSTIHQCRLDIVHFESSSRDFNE